MKVCLFEDNLVENLHPLTYLRPVFELKTGILSLKEKIKRLMPDSEFIFWVRDYLKTNYAEKNQGTVINNLPENESILFINGRLLANSDMIQNFFSLKEGECILNKNVVVAAKLNTLKINKKDYLIFPNELSPIDYETTIINYPWDLVNVNGKEIISDFNLIGYSGRKSNSSYYPGVSFINPGQIYIGENVSIKPGVVLDAEDGPVVIEDGTKILHNSVLQGPVFIGKNSSVKIGAKIYHNTSIGDVCKVGGEIEESIIHGYSNKQHDGFLGHAYLCEWNNLGADTNNSDLKNNYGNVSVIINGSPVDSGSQFVGLIMGDHSKTAINTQLNTGTVVGISSNIVGNGFPPKYIPSFSWGGFDKKEYELNKAISVAEIVMGRRKIMMTDSEKNLFKYVFEKTAGERAV